ncbi:hypothetical protein BDZ91DRAFT_796678 [Kalaharituber pfeilii]|nr:hypothetical protein BDZ91DRAFT_796678 [Kalaharituber pfeilii]
MQDISYPHSAYTDDSSFGTLNAGSPSMACPDIQANHDSLLSNDTAALGCSSGTSGPAAVPPHVPLAPQFQQLRYNTHASTRSTERTHAYHQRSESGSSTEGERYKTSSASIAAGGSASAGGAGEAGEAGRAHEDDELQEADAALLIGPIISRTQSATYYDHQRNGSTSRVPVPAIMLGGEDDGDESPSRISPRQTVKYSNSAPQETVKEQMMGVLSSTAHRLSTISNGFSLSSKSTTTRHDGSVGGHGTSASRAHSKRTSLFTFTLPSFHLPQLPSPPAFLTPKSHTSTRKRSKSNILFNASSESPGSKTPGQSPRASMLFFSKSVPPETVPERTLRRSSSQPSLLSYTSSRDEDERFASVQSMTNARIKAIKDNFRGLSPLSQAANALSTYANSLNSALSSSTLSASPVGSMEVSISTVFGVLPQPKPHPLDLVEGDVVVMGGYRGSVLREAAGAKRRVWIPLRVGLNLRKDCAGWDVDAYRAGDIGRRLIRRLRAGQAEPSADGSKLGRRVFEYGYDWRLSPALLSRKLIEYLEKLPCNKGAIPGQPRKRGQGALVIAHSLGGLIVRHAVNQRPELFSGVLFAGTPQHCVNILGPLRNGDTVMLSSKVLSAQVNFTMRSSFALLPDDGECFVDKNTGQKIFMDFFDASNWVKYGLSPCVTPQPSSQQTDQIHAPPGLPNLQQQQNGNGGGTAQALDSTSGPTGAQQQSGSTSFISPFSQISPSFSESRICTLPLNETVPYLERTLKEIKKFKEELRFRPDIGYAESHEEWQRRRKREKRVDMGVGEGVGKGVDVKGKGKAIDPEPAPPSIQASTPNSNSEPKLNLHPQAEDPDVGSSSTAAAAIVAADIAKKAEEERNCPRCHYPPLAIIYSKNVPTVKGARVNGLESITRDDVYDDLVFGAGDGVCLAKAAQLPEGYRACAKVLSDRGHISLLGDLDGLGKAVEAIVKERGW